VALIDRQDRDSIVVAAAFRLVVTYADFAEFERQGSIGMARLDRYLHQFHADEQTFIRRLKYRAALGAPAESFAAGLSRRTLWKQAQGVTSALDERGVGIYTKDRVQALRSCALIALGVAQSLITGATLPAICSSGSDW